jgi:hypothetical protein
MLFETLGKAPIVEAVIQFNAPPSEPFEQARLKDLLASRLAGYKLQGQMQVKAGRLVATFTSTPFALRW